ncbi:MAG: SLC13 family permease [Rhodospirillales bacterium]|nr:SLC13 family permease [Rhodospirillales bacterium]
MTLITEPPEGLAVPAWRLVGVAVLMACWWITEAIPIPATAMVPLALFPLLDIASIREAGEPYGHRVVFLLLGGFMIALAMQRWGLHRRIALNVVSRVGGGPRRVIAGFMLPAAFLSMWISNTAAATMMVPIGLSVLALFQQDEHMSDRGKSAFACALMLSIAFAANVGGMSTLIGTPPNAVLAGVLQETFGYEISFAEWLAIGLPMTIVFLPLIWIVLTRVCFAVPAGSAPHHQKRILADVRALGPLSRAEITVLLVLLVTASLWLARRTLNDLAPGLAINDTSIAVWGALALFLLPVGRDPEGHREFALDWATAMRLPWGVLVLLGGGFSLAAAIKATGLAAWIGDSTAVVAVLPILGLLFLVTLLIVLLTEINSNTATTATFIPVLAAVAVSIGENPLLLCIPATFAASAAFMLPIATAPNAVVFASGHVPSSAMLRAGLVLNPIAALVIVALTWFLLGPALGVVPGDFPDWAVNSG